jgi:hypothetical protein
MGKYCKVYTTGLLRYVQYKIFALYTTCSVYHTDNIQILKTTKTQKQFSL